MRLELLELRKELVVAQDFTKSLQVKRYNNLKKLKITTKPSTIDYLRMIRIGSMLNLMSGLKFIFLKEIHVGSVV